MNKQDLLTQLENEAYLMSEIKNIICNNVYYHSSNGYNMYMTTFIFIDLDNQFFKINVLYDRSINHIKELIIKKYHLNISYDINNIDFCNQVKTKKELYKNNFIKIIDLL